MSAISRAKRFFAQTISGYSEVMRESNPDWQVVAKKIMYDIRVFNAEICDLNSDDENELSVTKAQKANVAKETSLPQVLFRCGLGKCISE